MRVQSERYFICSDRVLLLHQLIFEAVNRGFNPLAPRYFCLFTTFPSFRPCLRDSHMCVSILRHAFIFNVEAREGDSLASTEMYWTYLGSH